MTGKSEPTRFTTNRSSQRLSVAIPISVKGKDAKGKSFSEQTRTLEVNRTGARIWLSREVALETTLQVSPVGSPRSAQARVVWSKPVEHSDHWEMGIALKGAEDFWGIQFPSEGEWKPKGSAQEEQPAASEAARPHAGSEEAASEAPSPAPTLQEPPAQTRPAAAAAGPFAAAGLREKDITELFSEAVAGSLQSNIREIRQSALESAEQHLRNTIRSCGENLEMQAIEIVGRNEQALQDVAGAVQSKVEQQLERRADEITTKSVETLQQMLQMVTADNERLKQESQQAVATAAAAVRQKLTQDVPALVTQITEHCQARVTRLLNGRVEDAEATINKGIAELSRQMASRSEQVLARFEIELERMFTRFLASQSEKMEKHMQEATGRTREAFDREITKELARRREQMLEELEETANKTLGQNLQRARRVLSRSIRDLAEGLQHQSEHFGKSTEE